jgi:hypothetical protein
MHETNQYIFEGTVKYFFHPNQTLIVSCPLFRKKSRTCPTRIFLQIYIYSSLQRINSKELKRNNFSSYSL